MKLLAAFICLFLSLTTNAQSFDELYGQFMDLFKKREYKTAIPVGEKVVAQAQKEFGEKHLNYAVANHNLAEAYYALQLNDKAFPYYQIAIKVYTPYENSHGTGLALCRNSVGSIFFSHKNYDSAAFYYNQAFNYFIKTSEENYDNLVILMNNLGETYFTSGKNNQAQNVYEKVLPVIKKKEGTENENYYITLSNLGWALSNQQLLALAEQQVKLALSIVEKLKGDSSLEYANILDQLSATILEQGRPNEAVTLISKSYGIKISIPGIDTLSLVSALNSLAGAYSDLADYAKAENFYNQAILLSEKSGAQETQWYETTLRNFGYHYITAGKTLEAKEILEKALAVQTKNYGAEHPENGMVLTMIGSTEFLLNQFSAAEAHVKQGMALTTKLYGKENYAIAKAFEILASIYHKQGKSDTAIEIYKEATNIYKKVFGSESRHIAYAHSTLGVIYQETGNFAQAEIVLKESMRIRKKLYGIEHPDYALSLANLAMIYMAQGRYFDADPLLADALKIIVSKGLKNSNSFLTIINNIALMSSQQGMYDDAKKLFGRLMEIISNQKEKNDAILFVVLNNLSQISIHEKNYEQAISYALQAIDIAKTYFGVQSIDYIKSLNNLLATYIEIKDFEKAQSIFLQIIPLCKEVLGPQATLLSTLYFNASAFHAKSGNFSEANYYIDSANAILLKDFRQNFYTLSEKEKLTWWQSHTHQFDFAPSLLMKNASSAVVENFANKQLQLKGFVLSDAASALRRARQSNDVKLKKLIDEWQLNRTLLAAQEALPVNQRSYSMDSLKVLANELEKQINVQSAGLLKQNTEILDWKKIQSSLPNGEAAIEFIRFKYFDKEWTDTIQYAALIIQKDKSPQFVSLCTEEQIAYCLNGAKNSDKEVNIGRLYRSTITGKANTGKFLGDSLYQLVWQPLMPYLQNVTTISFAPDGLLHKVAFHALPTPDKKILLDIYHLQQYTSIRQLAGGNNDKDARWNSAFLLGNADFTRLVSANKTVTATNQTAITWTALPGTGKEIANLQQVLNSKGVQVTNVNGTSANEESFKKLDGHSPAIMHIATHGFFLPDPQAKASPAINETVQDSINRTSKKETTTTNQFALSSDPLMRSGIVLSGANQAWSGIHPPAGIEDGVLTAYEITQQDLHSTRLVVLSACETALGDLQGSEGVFGLQRAFKIAGVKNMVVSLWQVPDKETVELMTKFYTNLLAGKGVREAFYHAQKEMRSKYSPFYWAAFVLVE